MSVSQHHDAIVGTSLPAVVADSLMRLGAVRDMANDITASAVGALAAKSTQPALSANSSAVAEALAQGRTAVIVVSNGLGWSRDAVVAVPVPAGAFVVSDSSGKVRHAYGIF